MSRMRWRSNPASAAARDVVGATVAAAVVVATLTAVISVRGEQQGPAIRGDSAQYVRMTEEGLAAADAPFRYRPLVPILARMLPLDAPTALRVLTLGGLGIALALLIVAGRQRDHGFTPVCLGVLAAFCSRSMLYNVHNPFLTDGVAAALLALACTAAWRGHSRLAFAAIAIGVLAREPVLFALPMLLGRATLRQWLIGGAVIALCFLAPRVLLSDGGALTESVAGAHRAASARGAGRVVGDAFASFGVAWAVAAFGVLRARAEGRAFLLVLGLSLGAGAVVTSAVATDTTRMFGLLFPFAALACIEALSELWRVSRTHAVALTGALAADALLFTPTGLFDPASVTPGWRAVPYVAAIAIGLHLAWRARRRDGQRVSSAVAANNSTSAPRR